MRSNGDKRTAQTLAAPGVRRARKLTGRIAIATLVLAVLGALMQSASAASDPPSTYAGKHLTARQAMEFAYKAGFHTQKQLVTVTAIGLAESGLVTGTRNWHPEFGYRPASDAIGVQGPAAAWNGNRQMHSDRGAWQISSHFWPQYTDAQTDNPATAAKIMFSISHSGTDFSPWNTFTAGDSANHTDGLGPIARAVIADGGGNPAAPAPKPAVTKPKAKPKAEPAATKPKAKPKAKPAATKPKAKPKAKPVATKPKPAVTIPDRSAPDDARDGGRHHHRRHHHGHDRYYREWTRWSDSSRCHR
jgi:Lysozyme like domain